MKKEIKKVADVATPTICELPEMAVSITEVEAVIFMQALRTVDILRRSSNCVRCGGKR